MGKKSAKKQSKDSSNGILDGIDAKQLGVTVAGLIVGELVQVATQRLIERGTNSEDDEQGDDDEENRLQPVNAVKSVATQAGSQIKSAGSTVGDTAQTVQASASNVAPYLGELVDVLQDVGQRLKEKSVSSLSDSPDAIADSITTTARNALGALASNDSITATARNALGTLTSNGGLALLDKSDKKSGKSKKKGKKKKKKKK
jgi:hypothetical protein